MFGLVLLLGLGCPEPGDARRYALASSEAEDWPEARSLCLGIRDPSSRGDCLVAGMERFSTLDPEECRALQKDEPEMAVWRDECMFQLAERLRGLGRFDEAMVACLDTRFARECFWHLVQDEAEASLDEAGPVAEARIARFRAAGPIPDAALQFWAARFRAEAEAGRVPGEEICTTLQDPAPCHEGLRRFVRSRLDGQLRLDALRACAATAQGPGSVPVAFGWVPGPVADASVARWHERHCAQEPVEGRPP